MKKLIAVIMIMFVMNMSYGQKISFDPRTGDVEMDGFLKDVHEKAKNDRDGFISDVVQTFNSTNAQVEGLLNTLVPGDVYMSFQTAEVIGQPVQTVADAYSKNKGKGWGQIAKDLGIKPGSAEFHAMKNKMKGKKNKGEKGNGKGKGKGKNK